MTPGNYQFGVFIADVSAGELRKNGARLKLQERPFQLLVSLLERPGEVVSREELRQRLWPDGTYVDFDHSISSAINKLRGALNDSATHPRYIETVGRRGYRFLADVKQVAATNGASLQVATPVVSGIEVRRRTRWSVALALVVVVAAAAAGYWWWFQSRRAGTGAGARVLLAVLPFQNLTGDPAQEYFSDGMTEEMLTQLGRLDPQRLGVIALRTSVFHYQRTPQELDQMLRQLGVQYVLEGSVRRDANQVRISANLIQMKDQSSLFARAYDRQLTGVLTLQGEIAQEVADEIQLALGSRRKTMVAASAGQPALSPATYAAYDLYLKGRYFWNKRNADGFKQAAANFQQAIAADPQYARAYSGLADTYTLMSSYSIVPQDEYIPQARAAALRALQIDPGLAEAHTSLALIAENYDYDWQTAEREYLRAIELDPNYATAHQWYAECLSFEGRFDQALAESERARELDPLSLIIATDNGAILLFAHRYDAAAQQLRSVLAMQPSFSRAEGLLTGVYIQKGQFALAQAVIQKWDPLPGQNAWVWAYKAYLYGRAGQKTQALHAAQEVEKMNKPPRFDSPVMLAMVYSNVGKKDEALTGLEQAFREHSNAITGLKSDPIWDPLRSDPRFQDLVRRVFGNGALRP